MLHTNKSSLVSDRYLTTQFYSAGSKIGEYELKDKNDSLVSLVFFLKDIRHWIDLGSMWQQMLESRSCKNTLCSFCSEKKQLLHTQAIWGLKWETLIEPQIAQKGFKVRNTHSPLSIQKHDSASSHSFRRKKGMCSPEVSCCFQSAVNMLLLLLSSWNQTKWLHQPHV